MRGKQGFSITELLVTLVIIAGGLLLSIPFFLHANKTRLDIVSQSIYHSLQVARNYAIQHHVTTHVQIQDAYLVFQHDTNILSQVTIPSDIQVKMKGKSICFTPDGFSHQRATISIKSQTKENRIVLYDSGRCRMEYGTLHSQYSDYNNKKTTG